MKQFAFYIALLTSSVNVFAQTHSLLNMDILNESSKSERLIEPTSPILGTSLSNKLRLTPLHPEELYNQLKASPNLDYELYLSALTYLSTLYPELEKYCAEGEKKTLNRNQLTEIMHAAIPLQVLTPLHNNYIDSHQSFVLSIGHDIEALKSRAKQVAHNFQRQREDCGVTKKLERFEDKLENYCLGWQSCKNSKEINHILSSAETGYPRIQYSLNGYTRYVYTELFKNKSLQSDLRIIYDLEKKWLLENTNITTETESFFGYVSENALKVGMHPKDLFLILAYSMRNMPSLDIEYTQDPKKALLLETYFWAFKNLKTKLRKPVASGKVFSNTQKKLGIYHYLTASLLSCESRLTGQGHSMAKLVGIISKLGYKGIKLLKAIDTQKYEKDGFKYVIKVASKQGFKSGVLAGVHGGDFGSKVCGKYYGVIKKDYDKSIIRIKKRFSFPVRRGYKRYSRRSNRRIKPLDRDEKIQRMQLLRLIAEENDLLSIASRSVLKP
ncbi:MAG: hypothetical protein HON90_04180 [Halobacteriovoraceae bacterium]|jgi:hypothetical protein|nr:hypothetical protein [Halobacteriovoraceae bacterium]